VLEGSVRRGGNKLRITTNLIDVINGKHLWAQRYDRDVKDVFAVQTEVTEQVVKAMAVTLKANELDRLFQKHVTTIDAYDAFVRARRAVDPPGKESIAIAQKLFRRAIELDPKFAGDMRDFRSAIRLRHDSDLGHPRRKMRSVHSNLPIKQFAWIRISRGRISHSAAPTLPTAILMPPWTPCDRQSAFSPMAMKRIFLWGST
jgi:hypothetical protein